MLRLFYLSYLIACLLLFFCPKVVIIKGDVGTNPTLLSDLITFYIIIGAYWWLRKHKEHPVIGQIYRALNLLFAMLFVTLLGNYVKKSVKEWWKE